MGKQPSSRPATSRAASWTLREIPHGGADYAAAVALRRAVLRTPLGLDFTAEELRDECGYTHVAAFAENGLAAVLVLIPLDARTVRMRQVVVRPDLQGRGLGRRLIRRAEGLAAARGYETVELHARPAVVEFYRKLGYRSAGSPVLELGIRHQPMRKTLEKATPASEKTKAPAKKKPPF